MEANLNTQKIQALKKKVQKIIDTTELRSQKVLGVSCSRSDQEMIVMYCDNLLTNGRISGLMMPIGNVGQVFLNAEIEL